MSQSTLSITPTSISLNLRTKSYISSGIEPLTVYKHTSTFSIESRLSSLSSSVKVFNESVSIDQEALKKSGNHYKLKYQKSNSATISNQQRYRKKSLLNPPCSMNIATHVGSYLLNLFNKLFPPQHKFSKIFNSNNMRIS